MTVSGPPSTTALLKYSVEPANGVRAFININVEKDTNCTQIQQEVVIENLRGKEDSVSLDTAGFQLFNRPSKHKAFTNDAEIEREYYPESIEFIKEVTGASKVVLFDHSQPILIYIYWCGVDEYPGSHPSSAPWRNRHYT